MQFTHPTAAPITIISGPVVPTNDPTLLFSGGIAAGGTEGPFDISIYNSVLVYSLMAGSGTTAANIALNWQVAPGPFNALAFDAFMALQLNGGEPGQYTYRTECKGKVLYLASDQAAFIRLVGSAQNVPQARYTTYNTGGVSTGVVVAAFDGYSSWQSPTVPHGGSGNHISADVPSSNGPAFLHVANLASHGPLVGAVVDADTGVAYGAITVPATAGAFGDLELNLPNRPVHLRLENDDPTNDTTATITLIYNTA